MLNQPNKDVTERQLKVLRGVKLSEGMMNTPSEIVIENMRKAVVLPYPQIRPQDPNYDRVCIVGGGPSLEHTEKELRDLYFEGAFVVTVNGAYNWCIERNLMPKMQIVLDARSFNARFVDPPVPRCRYVLASQCHPDTWKAVEGREEVFIFHAVIGKDTPEHALLNQAYAKQWYGVGGGVTVVTRALAVLRMLGYLRFDLFGVDCCWMDTWALARRRGRSVTLKRKEGKPIEYPTQAEAKQAIALLPRRIRRYYEPARIPRHHAYPQAENRERRLSVLASPPGSKKGAGREFECAPWHLKQLEGMLQIFRVNGKQFRVNVHGDGLLSYVMRESAFLASVTETKDRGRTA